MKKKPHFEIGSILKHIPTKTIIKLEKYGTQQTLCYARSIGGGITRIKPNYNILHVKIIETGQLIKGLTKEFELWAKQ